MTQIRAQHHHTPLVWVASPEVFPDHSPFFQFSPGQSGVGNFAAGIFVGSPSYPGSMDKQPINKSTKPWKRPMDRHSCVVPWPGFLWSWPRIPCSDAVACDGWLKIYMQSAEDVIKERLQVEGQVKADVSPTTSYFFPSLMVFWTCLCLVQLLWLYTCFWIIWCRLQMHTQDPSTLLGRSFGMTLGWADLWHLNLGKDEFNKERHCWSVRDFRRQTLLKTQIMCNDCNASWYPCFAS